jgi:protein gp37
MSDIFHEEVPFEFVDRIMDTIRRTPQHRYQILTKRAERMDEYFSTRLIPQNVWLGVTVECRDSKVRIDHLRKLDASIKFLSCEPLVEDLRELDLRGIDWIIVGGESGPQARPMLLDWVVNIKQQVEQHGAAFFFKQWGTWGSDGIKRNKHANGKLLFGKVIQQMPEKMAV